MRIVVLFVEPMLYGLDLIHEVYEKTEHEYRYVYCARGLTGRDELPLPAEAVICEGSKRDRRHAVIRGLRDFKPDVAIINGYVGNEQVAAIRFCQRHGIKYAIESDTPLNIPNNKAKAIAKKVFLFSVLRNRLCFGFPGGTLQKQNLVYYGIPDERCFIMPMSVSAERLRMAWDVAPSRESIRTNIGLGEKRTFLFVGRLEKEKNVSLLIRAYKQLVAKYGDAALLIVGDGSEASLLRRESAGYADVHFVGYRAFPKLVEYYKAADVFVLPSRYEPWGLVVNEAMTLGVPVIASSAVGCHPDLIADGVNGWVFKNEDVDDLTKVMELALNQDIQLLARAAESRMERWNYNRYTEKLTKALKRIRDAGAV